MYFYEVCVAHNRATKQLTYHSKIKQTIGQVVVVPFGTSSALGFIVSEVKKPKTVTKALEDSGFGTKLPSQLLSLVTWLTEYYPASTGRITSLILPSRIVLPEGKKIKKVNIKQETLPKLLPKQTYAVSKISETNSHSVLLHGITGSGKTRIYIELARKAGAKGRSTIILSPEIGLTAQLVETIQAGLPEIAVRLIHSHMSTKKKSEVWHTILEAEGPQIVIGPRSALFMPLKDVGYIIVDEAHDSAYKNNSQPYYQTTRVAGQLAKLHGGKLILATATPLVSDYYIFKSKNLPIVRLDSLAKPQPGTKKDVCIIDIKDRAQFSKSPWLADRLLGAIDRQIKKKQQSLIFLNRRGTAKVTMCSSCGWQALCPHCDTPLTFHSDNHTLVCHTCNFKQRVPSLCPVCQQTNLVFKSMGTKFIVDELSRLFPHASIMRFDSDVPRSQQMERLYSTIADGSVDILVGTQLLSKGWDFPKLGLVGVVTADTSLFFPDYTAEETTFQLIQQVIGRVHRGHIAGTAIVQTYQPKSSAILSAVTGNYTNFYASQISEREQFNYPPYVFTMKLWAKRASRTAIQSAAHELAQSLKKQYERNIDVLGPSPALQERLRNAYTWQIIVKSKDRSQLTKMTSQLPSGWSYDIDPVHLL